MNYELIPVELRPQVREWIKMNEMRKLWELHQKYKLTKYDYSCCGLDGMMNFYRDGLATGQI